MKQWVKDVLEIQTADMRTKRMNARLKNIPNEKKEILNSLGNEKDKLSVLSAKVKESEKEIKTIEAKITDVNAKIDDLNKKSVMIKKNEEYKIMLNEVANTIRKSGKRIILVVNKVDNVKLENSLSDFAKLGFQEMFPVSCLHRIGIVNLVETLTKNMPVTEFKDETRLKLAVIGRPNVGKSSIVNKLIGESKLIVSDLAGTTRDAVDMPFDIKIDDENKLPATIIDTAGLRKKGKADSAIEIFSIMRAKEAIERSDIVLFVIESAEMGATSQDANIGKIINDAGKACIIIANKWDTCSGFKAIRDKGRNQKNSSFHTICPNHIHLCCQWL